MPYVYLLSPVCNTNAFPRKQAVTVSSLYYNWEQWPPVGLMLLNALLLVIKIPFIAFYKSYADGKLSTIQLVFDKHDADKDGFVSVPEAALVLSELPLGTFEHPISPKLQHISLDVIMWITNKHRMLFFRLIEFVGSFAMFFAALMLFTPGAEANAIIYVQGVQSALGLVLVLSDVLEEHGKKYHAKSHWLQVFANVLYWIMLVGTLAVLLSGYAVVLRLYEERYTFSFNITSDFPKDDEVGAIGGGIITAMIAFMLFVYLSLFTIAGGCGGCDVYVEHLGEDDPVKLLRRTAFTMKRKSTAAAGAITSKTPTPGASGSALEYAQVVAPPPTNQDLRVV
ncbi:hypothetical protein BASA81_001439 [Batrachochytrium salamandrivorans]|nr:hypothetical protein BASA81_001439 [Batrachochytrium salamandrivorans]